MGKLSKLALYWRTMRHLRPVQFTNRLKRRVFPAKPRLGAAPPIRDNLSAPKAFIDREQSILSTQRFRFLNLERNCTQATDWNDPTAPKLWLFNLHYFDGLLNDQTDTATKHCVIERWIDENPAAKGNGWEPYPNGLRIANWIKWAISGEPLSDKAHQSLFTQARFLHDTIEYHLLANHLFVTLKGVFFAACYFSGDEAEAWYQKCLKELDVEVKEQFLKDGGHFELSPTYHALLTEDLLDLINIIQVTGRQVPDGWTETAQKALEWLHVMTRPDGLPPLFNDAANGISPTYQKLLDYGARLGIQPKAQEAAELRFLPDSGYFRKDTAHYTIIGDVGQIGVSYQPAHVHCDMFNFELMTGQQPIIVDSGTSIYDNCARRDQERGTAAHNTVQIGDLEQSEVWGGFRVGRRAYLFDRLVKDQTIEAKHDGFKSVGAIHKRLFDLREDRIILDDHVLGCDRVATARLHIHPDVTVRQEGDVIFLDQLKVSFNNASNITLNSYEYGPEFYKLIPATVIEATFVERLTTIIEIPKGS